MGACLRAVERPGIRGDEREKLRVSPRHVADQAVGLSQPVAHGGLDLGECPCPGRAVQPRRQVGDGAGASPGHREEVDHDGAVDGGVADGLERVREVAAVRAELDAGLLAVLPDLVGRLVAQPLLA